MKSQRGTLTMRPMLPADAPLLAQIFRASVEELGVEDYSDAQVEAWAAVADDEEAFAKSLAEQLTLIAMIDGEPVGFASLKGNDKLEMLYVHPARSDRAPPVCWSMRWKSSGAAAALRSSRSMLATPPKASSNRAATCRKAATPSCAAMNGSPTPL